MALEPGSELGPYVVLAPLGTGGMGEVYRAREPALGREVALKVLPAAFAADPRRLARFEREARALAALSHPGIAAIHGLGESNGLRFLVLELVPGTTLAERLLRGPLPVREALALAAQIAEALAAAHEQGFVHRDVKPSNVNVTPGGRAKLLDFGLARALTPGRSQPSEDPTLTAATAEGEVHGTAAYMSPEQARGEEVDRRSDVWSFGCLLYEALTGRRAFAGATASDTIAAVLEHEPDWTRLPAETPESVRSLLRRCLRKDRARRLHDAADAQLELEEALSGVEVAAVESMARGPGPWTGWWVAGALALLLAAVWLQSVGTKSDEVETPAKPFTRRLDLQLPAGTSIPKYEGSSVLALSKDGSHFAFIASGRLWVRRLDDLAARVVADVNEVPRGPFLSPDGTWLGYESQGKLKLARTDGGSVRTLCDAPALRGADWSEDGRILFASGEGRLAWISPAGGEPEPVPRADPEQPPLRWPQVLPGGKLALATTLGSAFGKQSDWRILLVSLETGESRVLLDTPGAAARYLPSGHLVYQQGGTGKAHAAVLEVARFDLRTREVSGASVTLLPAVYMAAGSGAPFFGVSDAGLLVYAPTTAEPPARELVWVDREGRVEPASARKGYYSFMRLSPDGTRVAVLVGAWQSGSADIWILDLGRDTLTRLSSVGDSSVPVWTPDGRGVVFASRHTGATRLYRLAVDRSGPPEPLSDALDQVLFPQSITPDGRALLFAASGQEWDLHLLPLDSGAAPTPWLVTPANEVSAAISPDGRWVAYRSSESGVSQIFVRPFSGRGPMLAISRDGGQYPVWSRDGGELFFREPSRQPRIGMMVSVRHASETIAFDPPRKLFDLPERAYIAWHALDVTADGRFLMILEDPRESDPLRLVVAPGWPEELPR